VFALLVPSCCNKFEIYYQTCYKVVPTSLIQSRYNKNVTRLMTQGCNNIVISWLYRTCWNNLATNLIMPSCLLQIVNSLFQTCHNNWEQAVRTQLVDGFLANLLQDVRFFFVYKRKYLASCSKSANKPSTSCVRTACPKLSTSLEQSVNNL
jgi:hypothetical protein